MLLETSFFDSHTVSPTPLCMKVKICHSFDFFVRTHMCPDLMHIVQFSLSSKFVH